VTPEFVFFVGASLWPLGLAATVLAVNKPRSISVLSFAAGMLVLAADSFVALRIYTATDVDRLLDLGTIHFIMLSGLPAVWLTFSLSYSRGNAGKFLSQSKSLLIAIAFLPLVPLLWSGHLFIVDPQLREPGGTPGLTWLARGLHLVILVSAVSVLMNLERTFWASVGTLRWRIKFVILGLIVVFAARFYTSSQALLYSHLNLELAIFNAGALVLGCLLITVSFSRTPLAGAEVYPSTTGLDKSLSVILAGSYLLVVGVFAKVVVFLGGDAAFSLKAFFVLVVLTSLGVLLASERARFQFRRFLSRHFHRPFYDYRALWRNFTERTSSIVDERTYARELVNLISDAVQTLSVSIWIEQPGTGRMIRAASTSPQTAVGDHAVENLPSTPLAEHLARHPEPFVLDDCREDWVALVKERNPDQFRTGGKRVCVALPGKDRALGMIIIGDRVNGIGFSVEDFELFKCVAAQAASALLNLHLTRQLLQAREMEAFQTMSAFFVHDLKNTASTMSLMLENLPAHFDDPNFREDALRAISKSVARINELIRRLTLLRQKLELQPVAADLNQVISDALAGLEGAMNTKLVRRFDSVPRVLLDPDQIQKVVVNLLLNARDAVGKAGEIQIETAQQNGWVIFSVKDNGCGMTGDFVNHSLFRPFHSTKKKGIGIGMFHTKMIVDAHQGRIEVETEEQKGTTVRVLLPLQGIQ
jgi:putative PEP-CTERM system histidine kinase